MSQVTHYRARFDADISFLNGGGLQTQGFLLDIPGEHVATEELATLLVAHLGLLMVERVDLSDVQIVEAPHRGSRNIAAANAAGQASGQLIDLSHVIHEGMITYPGMPGPEFLPYLTREASRSVYAPGTEFSIGRISMVGNTGTYLDSPFHRYDGGTDLAGLTLDQLADLPITVARFEHSSERGINALALASSEIAGRAVLLQTGWDAHFGSPSYAGPAPFLTEDGANHLIQNGAVLVGIDSVNIDDTASGGDRPAHSLLLAAGIPVLEHLTNLAQVPSTGARLHAVPPKVAGFGTFPVRAYAVVSATR